MGRLERDRSAERSTAFGLFLRTGLRSVGPSPIEVKFNPYHDPRDGRFTFAPGGAANATANRRKSATVGQAVDGGERAGSAARPAKPAQSMSRVGGGFTGGGGGTAGGGGASGDGYWLNPREAAEFQQRHPGMIPQVTRPGDTLASVARDHQISVAKLAAVNRLAVDAKLQPGTVVAIPSKRAEPRGEPASVAYRQVPASAPAAVQPARSTEHPESADSSAPTPYRHIVKAGYDYSIDAAGRTREVEGTLTRNADQGRNALEQARAGGNDRLPDDHGGHYIARRFNGPTDAFNHFAQNGRFNKSGYAKLENGWARAMKGGLTVRVHIDSFYPGTSKRPDLIRVRYRIDEESYERDFPNTSGRHS